MTLLNVYLWISTILFMFLGTVWLRTSLVNVTLKIAFWFLALSGLLMVLSISGVVLIDGTKLGVA